jgi:hypothetical protein
MVGGHEKPGQSVNELSLGTETPLLIISLGGVPARPSNSRNGRAGGCFKALPAGSPLDNKTSFGPGRSMTEMIALPTKIIASKEKKTARSMEKIACFAQMIATFARKTAQSCSMHRKPTTKPT